MNCILALVAQSKDHVSLPLAELADRTARQLDERRAATGKWEPNPELVAVIRAYMPEFAGSEDAETELGASGDLAGDDVRVYSRELFDAECLAATRLAQLLGQDTPLFKVDELETAMPKAAAPHELVLGADQR